MADLSEEEIVAGLEVEEDLPPADVACPYKGLAAFEADDAEWRELDLRCRITISRFRRDRAVWDRLEQILRSLGEARAWCAGCASGEEPHSLVLAGRMGWGMKGLEKLIRDHGAQEYVLFSGYVPDEALPRLMAEVLPRHRNCLRKRD